MNTEISEHAKEAVNSFLSNRWEMGDIPIRAVEYAIQYGIILAVEARDKRIAELEAACLRNAKRDGSWIDECGSCRVCDGEIPHGHSGDCDYYKQEQQLQSKDREIERLKVELTVCKETEKSLFSRTDFLQDHKNKITAQLSEANAKLSELQLHFDRMKSWADFQTDKLSSAQAEIERLKVENLNLINKINDSNGWRRDNFPLPAQPEKHP